MVFKTHDMPQEIDWFVDGHSDFNFLEAFRLFDLNRTAVRFFEKLTSSKVSTNLFQSEYTSTLTLYRALTHCSI